jgi:hypothetical protein
MTTTSTYLQIVNRVIENLGDKPVSAFANSGVARKVQRSVNDAIADIIYSNSWNWAKGTIPATSWSTNVATVLGVSTFHGVSYGTNALGYFPVPFVDEETIDRYALLAGVARSCALSNDSTIKFYPYPANATEQSKYRFYVSLAPVLPVVESDLVQLFPERYVPLIVYRATVDACSTVIDDKTAMQTWLALYNNQLSKLRTRERSTPTNYNNMFKWRTL